MKAKAMITMLVSVAMILTAPLVALGAPGGGGGGGGGGGDEVVIPDYGDLIILYRDDYGVPIPSPVTPVEDPETGEMVAGGLCWQPLAFNVEDEFACPVTCQVTTTPATVSVDQYNCAVTTGCSGCTQEVDFGRINDARSADTVFASQLADVIVNLATADCVSLDPAGRLVTSRVETGIDEYNNVTSTVTSAAIDSPLQNLAIYRQLMTKGFLGDTEGSIELPAGVLDTAARALGAGSGKTGWVGVDLVAYLNQIMGLTATTTILDPKICETYREEVMGNIELVEKCFLNYGATGGAYSYGRTANFGALPDPAYIPETQGGQGMPGWFEVLAPLDVSVPFAATFQIYRGPIFNTVFEGASAGSNGDYGIDDFAQAADDTRAVIDYMHSWPLPVVYATPVSCDAPAASAVDVSISAESGLQVPTNIIDGSEGREFIVTVANSSGSAGPATGTVTVTATVAAGGAIEGSPWTFEFTDLAVGASESWTTFFTVNIGQATTIKWTAVAAADGDVISSNNTQTATSNVRATGSGGGGRP